MAEATANNLKITKDRVKAWRACSDGYRWFLDNFPEGGAFADVHKALIEDRRGSDADWLVGKAFDEFDTATRVKQITIIAGADAKAIEERAAVDAEAATVGDRANAVTTGEGANAATTGVGAVAAAIGRGAKAQAGAGGAIVLAHRDYRGRLICIRASMVGQDGIEAGAWYSLSESGEFVKSDD